MRVITLIIIITLLSLGKNVISYVAPEVSFSLRDRRDMIELQVQANDEFRYCQLPLRTYSSNGVISSMFSNDDHRGLLLGLKDGKVQLRYYPSNNKTSVVLFEDSQTINDGQQHRIVVSRHISENSSSNDEILLEIDKRKISVPVPERSTLFFDVMTIGGAYRFLSENVNHPSLSACFANVTYNRHPLLPEGVVKSDRYDCFYQQGSICDRQIPCYPMNIRPAQFCGQNDCSMVCAPTSTDLTNRALVRYSAQLTSGQREQFDLTFFTTSANSTLYSARDHLIQVSIVIINSQCKFLIQNGPTVSSYDFPGRVRPDQWHTIQVQKSPSTVNHSNEKVN